MSSRRGQVSFLRQSAARPLSRSGTQRARAGAGRRSSCRAATARTKLLWGVGAYRVYQDPADLLAHLDELGVRLQGE